MNITRWFLALSLLSPLFAGIDRAEYKFSGLTEMPPWSAQYVNPKAAKAAVALDGAAETPVGKGALKISVIQQSLTTNASDSQVWIAHPRSLVGGKKYQISVLLKGSATDKVSLQFIKNGAPYSACAKPNGASVPVTPEWKTVTVDLEGVALGEGATLRLPDFFFGALPGGFVLYIAKVTLEEKP